MLHCLGIETIHRVLRLSKPMQDTVRDGGKEIWVHGASEIHHDSVRGRVGRGLGDRTGLGAGAGAVCESSPAPSPADLQSIESEHGAASTGNSRLAKPFRFDGACAFRSRPAARDPPPTSSGGPFS